MLLQFPPLTQNLPPIPASSLRPLSFWAPLPYRLRGCKQPGAIWVRVKAIGGFVPVATKTCQGSNPLELIGVTIPGDMKIWGYFIVDERFPPPTQTNSSA